MGVRAQLAARCSQRVGRLQRMPTLHATAAGLTPAEVNGELAMDGTAGNLGLILLRGVCFFDVPVAARWTAVRQRSLVGFVDFVGREGEAVTMAAVPPTFLAAWLFRRGGWAVCLAKGGRLAFSGPQGGFERGGQLFDLGRQLSHAPLQRRDLRFQLVTTRTRRRTVHGVANCPRLGPSRQDQFRRSSGKQ